MLRRDDGASQRDDDVDLVSRTNSAVISGKRSNGRFATALRAREGVTRNQHRRLDMAARSEMLQADQVYATLSARQLPDGFEDQWIDAVLQARARE